MGARVQETAKLADLPILTTRRACLLADCSRSTLQRSGPEPIGRRGRTFTYSTASIIAWMSSGLDRPPNGGPTAPQRSRSAAPTSDALDRLRALKAGAR